MDGGIKKAVDGCRLPKDSCHDHHLGACMGKRCIQISFFIEGVFGNHWDMEPASNAASR